MTAEQQTLAEMAFDRIYGLIMAGELPLGGVVNEVALSQRFGISRGPIREAVQRLQGLRLITREPYMRARVVSLSARDIVDIFQLREAAEGMACRLAAAHMCDADIAALADALERHARPARSRRRTAQAFDLHVQIARGCGNRRIEQLLCEDLQHLLRLYRRRSGDKPGRRDQAFEEHWQIVRALRARDPDLAESLMRAHIGRATASLVRALERDETAAGHERRDAA
ncbi:MAG: GntR family transcriptional regulator [Burkholderiales bacterium]|nr:MAG: GntR family transcriptional regulator [Burkholderiales bacterium]